MLLYDRLIEHAYRIRTNLDPVDRHRLTALQAAPVYELTSVVPLFADWEREKTKAVPRRPPHTPLWVEWRDVFTDETGVEWDWTTGSVIDQAPDEHIASFRENGPEAVLSAASRATEVYVSQGFRRLNIYPRNLPAQAKTEMGKYLAPAVGRLGSDCDLYYWLLWSDATQIEGVRLEVPKPTNWPCPAAIEGDFWKRHSIFGLPVFSLRPGANAIESLIVPWPAFMAFGLLHCKNVALEEHPPDERLQRRVIKAGNPPRITYKTLRIEVPVTVHKRETYAGAGDEEGPRFRFHLCSGHFKNLQHERYKHKGWHWWPAHWRGSKELGEVHSRYQLIPK